MHVSDGVHPSPCCSPIEGWYPTQHRVGMGSAEGMFPSFMNRASHLKGFSASQEMASRMLSRALLIWSATPSMEPNVKSLIVPIMLLIISKIMLRISLIPQIQGMMIP